MFNKISIELIKDDKDIDMPTNTIEEEICLLTENGDNLLTEDDELLFREQEQIMIGMNIDIVRRE